MIAEFINGLQQFPLGRAGSTPAAGIVLKTRFSDLVFFFYSLNF